MRLLFTGGGGAATEALPRLLPQHDVCFADADPDTGCHVLPMASRYDFLPKLVELCRRLQIDLLIPGVDEELGPIVMARRNGELPCKVLLPDYEFVCTHLDKLASMKALKAAGIPVPQTFRYGIIKPRQGRGSRDVQRVGHTDGKIVQEYLEGQEYTVTMVADQQQRLRAIVPVKVELKKGVTLRGCTERNDAVMEACWHMHNAMPTSGLYNIQGVLIDNGFKPFEINPRISTTSCLALAAGVDWIALSQDESPSVSNLLAPFTAVTLRRSWRNVFEVAA